MPKQTNQHPPFTHDLLRLAGLAKLDVKTEFMDWLDTITTFNLNTRYDSYKQEFYKKCTQQFSADWMEKIKLLRSWIKEKHLQ